ncbi:conserved exported hypothetical protein [Gammaproteobacteria bacterium]
MKRMIAIACLSLLPLIAHAESPSVTTAPPAAAPTEEVATGSAWRTVAAGLGVVGGVIVADLFMGGSLTASLVGWGSTATAAPVVYSPEVLGARAAGAVLGEMITPATHLRDAAARRDMFYTLVLGVGGVVGAAATYWWTGSAVDADIGSK